MRSSNKQKKIPEGSEYIVEKILDFKIENGIKKYFVKWQSYSYDQNTWEPVSNLTNCVNLIEEFETMLIKKQGKEEKNHLLTNKRNRSINELENSFESPKRNKKTIEIIDREFKNIDIRQYFYKKDGKFPIDNIFESSINTNIIEDVIDKYSNQSSNNSNKSNRLKKGNNFSNLIDKKPFNFKNFEKKNSFSNFNEETYKEKQILISNLNRRQGILGKDDPDRIKSSRIVDGEILCLIEWKNKNILNTEFTNTQIKNYDKILLIDYYERIMKLV